MSVACEVRYMPGLSLLRGVKAGRVGAEPPPRLRSVEGTVLQDDCDVPRPKGPSCFPAAVIVQGSAAQ